MHPIRYVLCALVLLSLTVPSLADSEDYVPPRLATYLAIQRRTVPSAHVISGFNAWRTVSIYRSHAGRHDGYDVAMPRGSRVVAGWSGQVVAIVPWYRQQVGISVRDAGGFEATYGHLKALVRVGDYVPAGGVVGRTLINHVDIKVKTPEGAFYDFGSTPAVAYHPRARVAARLPRVAYRPEEDGAQTGGERDGGYYGSESDRPGDGSAGDHGQGYDPDDQDGPPEAPPPVAYVPGPPPWAPPAERPDQAEVLRRYLQARYDVQVTHDEAARMVAEERAARWEIERQRAALHRLGIPSPYAMGPAAVAWARHLADEWRYRRAGAYQMRALERQARRRLNEARRELRRMGVPEPR